MEKNQDFIIETKKLKSYNGLKISTTILQVLILGLIVLLLATSVDTTNPNWKLGYAIVFAIILSYGMIALAIPLIISIVGLIKSIISFNKEECSLGTLIYFIVTTITPFVIFGLSILIGKEVPNWVG